MPNPPFSAASTSQGKFMDRTEQEGEEAVAVMMVMMVMMVDLVQPTFGPSPAYFWTRSNFTPWTKSTTSASQAPQSHTRWTWSSTWNRTWSKYLADLGQTYHGPRPNDTWTRSTIDNQTSKAKHNLDQVHHILTITRNDTINTLALCNESSNESSRTGKPKAYNLSISV